MPKKLKIAIIMAGPSSEYKISLQSGENIYALLKNNRKFSLKRVCLPKSQKETWRLLKRSVKKLQNFDLIFNALHGEFGEDGTIQNFFDNFNIRYTGSGERASKIGMDKILSKKLFQKMGLNVVPAVIFQQGEKIRMIKMKLPLVVKPGHCGSSVGVSIVKDKKELVAALKEGFRYDKVLIIEKYIKGREITCGVVENFQAKKIYPLMPTEIIPRQDEFFNYRAKYTAGATLEITPASLTKNLIKLCQKTAIQTHRAIGCRHYSRTDMILSRERPPLLYVLEINTLPGLTKNSLIPKQTKAAGLEFDKFLEHIIAISLHSSIGRAVAS